MLNGKNIDNLGGCELKYYNVMDMYAKFDQIFKIFKVYIYIICLFMLLRHHKNNESVCAFSGVVVALTQHIVV